MKKLRDFASHTARAFYLNRDLRHTIVSDVARFRPNFQQPPLTSVRHSGAEVLTDARRCLAVKLKSSARFVVNSQPYRITMSLIGCSLRYDQTILFILSGQTIRPTLKRDAESRLRDIESISRITNNIEVLPLSPQDDRIRIAVYRTLFNFDSPLYRYALGAVPSIRIIVDRGRVTLKGLVNSEFVP